MFCPECSVEFRPGFTICSDCRVALVPEAPPDSGVAQAPDPHRELVIVWRGNNPILLAVVKSVLDDSGIPYAVLGETSGRLEGASPVFGVAHEAGLYAIQVGADDAEEVEELLSGLDEEGE